MHDGTCENEKTCRDAEADHLRQGYGGQAVREGGDEDTDEEGRRGVSGLERPVRQGKGRQMRRLLAWLCALTALAFAVLAAFVAGLEIGHRRGYDEGWRDCKFDAKETLFPTLDDPFWKWHDSKNSVIRKRRSFFD